MSDDPRRRSMCPGGPAPREVRPALPGYQTSEEADRGSGPGTGGGNAALDRLRSTAVSVLSDHVHAGSLCVCCGGLWPCESAHLAATALGAG